MSCELELLTLNLWGLPWPVSRERTLRKKRFLEHFPAASYDLIGLQELWWPWRRTLHGRAPLLIPSSSRDSGLALAGRLPRSEGLRVDHFRHHRGVDRLKRKGALHAGAHTSGGAALAVVVTHLQAGRRHASVRARQLAQLLGELASERRPVVLMGDFNLYDGLEEDRESARRLHAAGFVDIALALSRSETTFRPCNPYVGSRKQAERFDRVYLRDGDGLRLEPLEIEVIDVAPRPLSDHHPVRARVRLAGQ